MVYGVSTIHLILNFFLQELNNIYIFSVFCYYKHTHFSAPEPKSQVHYGDHALSVAGPSVVVNLSHFRPRLFSETPEWNLATLDGKQELNVL